MQEIITARGHKNVLSTHRNTTEITKHAELSLKGDCIIAVGADKACADLEENFKKTLRQDNAVLKITIEAGGFRDTIIAKGSEKLILTHTEDMVVRKSDHICPRTLAIYADKAACDLDKGVVERLKHAEEKAIITLEVHEEKEEPDKSLGFENLD